MPSFHSRLSTSHRQNDAELCVAAHHAGVCLRRFFERIGFNHRAHAGQRVAVNLAKEPAAIPLGPRRAAVLAAWEPVQAPGADGVLHVPGESAVVLSQG